MQRHFGSTRVVLLRGDITEQDVDAIVNAANPSLMGGGGVDGAIHRKGEKAILEACRRHREALGGPLETGGAVITTAGNLPARHVIHTVGPVFHREEDPDALLSGAWRNSLELAVREGLDTVAFPSLSTGAYGFPIDRAAAVALGTVKAWLESAGSEKLSEVRIVLFSADDHEAWRAALEQL